MNYIRSNKGQNFGGTKPTSEEFCHKFGNKMYFFFNFFFDMLSESMKHICMTSPQLLDNLEIAEFCDETRKYFL